MLPDLLLLLLLLLLLSSWCLQQRWVLAKVFASVIDLLVDVHVLLRHGLVYSSFEEVLGRQLSEGLHLASFHFFLSRLFRLQLLLLEGQRDHQLLVQCRGCSLGDALLACEQSRRKVDPKDLHIHF